MPLKSTQTNKYETSCYVQEAPVSSELDPRGYKVLRSAEGLPYVQFDSTLQTFGVYNRMKRRYDANNVDTVIKTDERIRDLTAKNKWRGELNHPNPDIKGQIYSDIRMTIPEPMRTSHFISKNRLEGDRYRGVITTHPSTDCGRAATSEIIDIGSVPSFSVRLLGNMIPNAPIGQPNMRVTKVITFDMVDYPSHEGADGDIKAKSIMEYANVIFLKELAKYCTEQDENLKVVCESFQISMDEIMGISNGNIIVEDASSKIYIPLKEDIRREALSILTSRRF